MSDVVGLICSSDRLSMSSVIKLCETPSWWVVLICSSDRLSSIMRAHAIVSGHYANSSGWGGGAGIIAASSVELVRELGK